jgi:hypothetical protein
MRVRCRPQDRDTGSGKRAARSRKCESRPHPRGEYRGWGFRAGNQGNAEGEKASEKTRLRPPPQGEYRKSIVRRDNRKAANATSGGFRKREPAPHPKGGISRIDVVGR